jgi:ketosteroid isomerase-like protein
MCKFAITTMVLLSLFGGPALAQDKAMIEQSNQRFVAAFAKGDFQEISGMYTEDAYLLPPGAEMIRGRDDIKSFWIKAGAVIEDVKLSTVDVLSLSPDWAREIGTFSLKTKGSSPQEMSGKYVVIWRKVGADWKLATDIWNASR